jgi:hypothetical protein
LKSRDVLAADVTKDAMIERGKIIEVVVGSLKQIDPNLEQVSEATCLLGADAVIDSVGFVNLLVSLEHAFDQRVDLSTQFIEHSEASADDSPFRHVGSMADLIFRSLNTPS